MNINENITELVALTKSIIEEINLAKFRKEVDSSFLRLGFDNRSRNRRNMTVLNPIPLRSYHRTDGCMNPSCFQDSELMKKYSDHKAIHLAKFAKEVDKSSFLGLGFDSKVTVLNPIPLRSYDPVSGCMDHDHENSSSSNSTVTDCSGKKRRSPNGNQNNNINNNNVKKMRLVRSHPEPITPPPELVQLIGPLIRPVFLYMKKLEESDVRKDQNRLFVNEREKLVEFLTEEERISAFGKKDEKIAKPEGVDLIGMDRMGREYKLHLTKWGSLDKLVFNKEWYKIVDANGAKRGDCVHLWGYRKDDKFRLVVEFHHLYCSS
ncbi:hypothetical protein OROGR_010436 [Orobanche gracilis]